MKWVRLVAAAWLVAASALGAEEVLTLRRQYNQVAAGIDSLVQRYGAEALGRVADEKAPSGGVPKGMALVLIFWADDEAEVFLNGFPVGHTRLTPVRVEIPDHFLRAQNRLEAHCWDTERVESGFMAGLYLEDFDKQLRPIVLSRPEDWQTPRGAANGIYYTHALPDIPGAQVIWGDRLLGEVWLESQFSLGAVQRAAYRQAKPLAAAKDEAMEAQEVVGRLAKLQKRLEELEIALGTFGRPLPGPSFKKGRVNGLSFTLGKAQAPVESAEFKVAAKLLDWAQRLPAEQQNLVFRAPRPLKGAAAATASGDGVQGGKNSRENRQFDYRPPDERGPGGSGVSRFRRSGRDYLAAYPWNIAPKMWAYIIGVAAYMGVSGRMWWRLFCEKVWKK